MSGSIRLVRWQSLCCMLAACVTHTMDGGKPLKDEDPQVAAGKYNMQLGTAYLQQGNYALAREKLERALKQNPKDPDVHTSLGLLYDRTGDTKRRRQALSRSAAPGARQAGHLQQLRHLPVQERPHRRGRGAIRRRWRSNKLYRTPEVALTNAGVCLRSAKRLDEAEKKFAGAIRARPNYSEATVQLASLHLERNDDRRRRARWSTRISTPSSPSPTCCSSAVNVARAAKDRMSEEKYSRALRLDFPDSAQARALKQP